jgi:hypothetical protein
MGPKRFKPNPHAFSLQEGRRQVGGPGLTKIRDLSICHFHYSFADKLQQFQ